MLRGALGLTVSAAMLIAADEVIEEDPMAEIAAPQ
jgi:hypothetical protein